MRLAPDAAHHPIGIKCQVADGVDPFFFRLEIIRHRRPVRSSQWRVADKIEIRLRPAGDNGQARRDPVAALRLDIAQNGFPFEAVETFAH